MMRTLATVLAGIIIGAAAMWFAGVAGIDPADTRTLPRPMDPEILSVERSRLDAAGTMLNPRLERYTAPDDIEREILNVSVEPRSVQRELTLTTLLARLAEIDIRRAVDVAMRLGLERMHLANLYRRWAEIDASAAIAALAEMENPGLKRMIALEMLPVLGDDETGIELLSTILPDFDRPSFIVSALSDQITRNPTEALSAALALGDDVLRDHAIGVLAYRWGDEDPRAAMAHLDLIPDIEQRLTFFNNVLTRWARLDPSAALQFALTADEQYLSASSFAINTIANRVPGEVLANADRFPPQIHSYIESFAANVLAEQDPFAAMAAAENMPPGQLRETMLMQSMVQYARADPQNAVAWARSRQVSPRVMAQVINAVAVSDFEYAVEVAFEAGGDDLLLQGFMSRASAHPDMIPALADRLLANGKASGSAMMSLLSAWTDTRPQGALDWALSNNAALNSTTARTLAMSIGEKDMSAAISARNRVPTSWREPWLLGLATVYAQRDAGEAMDWIAQYRGQAGYDDAAATIVMRAATNDPVSAAALVDTLNGQASISAASSVANYWARQEPPGAARWVATLTDAAAKDAAIRQVANSWAAFDRSNAERWVLGLDEGSTRDAALQGFLQQGGVNSERLMDAFSSDLARSQAVFASLSMTARADPDQARALVEQYVTDPEQRELAEQIIQSASQMSSALPGNLIPLR